MVFMGLGEGAGEGYMKCVVPGCADKNSTRHRFPNPKKNLELFKLWIQAIGDESLSKMDPSQVYIVKRVCHQHFTQSDYSEGATRLHANAVPRLHLPTTMEEEHRDCNVASTSTASVQLPEKETEVTAEQSTKATELMGSEASTSALISAQRPVFEVPVKRVKENVKLTTPHTILKDVGIHIRRDMTPRKSKLYNIVKRMHRQIRRISNKKDSFRKRLFEAEKFAQQKGLEENLSILNKIAAQFIRCQIREATKTPRQHRFTSEEKILALTLFKQSPKAYRFLSTIFVLPSRSTLNVFLKEIQFRPGINENVFAALKESVKNMQASDKYVSLIFDEMSIMPNLTFNESKGYIDGFGDSGNGRRSSEIADHVLIFMIRGLKKKFKQPVCYTFSVRGGAKFSEIKQLLTEILRILINIGLKPITTICDQAQVNVKVLNSLLHDTKQEYLRNNIQYRGGFFEIDGFKIYPIFDPPHLIKGIRNNFINKKLQFGLGNVKKTADWNHIKSLYEHDSGPNVLEGLRALPHLTDFHIYDNKIKKMKVKFATQIFSQRVASTLKLASSIDSNNVLGHGAADTAELLFFFDKLFDSVNGNSKFATHGKTLRCGISDSSDHLRFWTEEALPLLATMEFQKDKPSDKSRPPSLGNWSFTIRNIINIWNALKDEGFEYLLGRHLNQDPLENFFGQVRSYGVRYTNPTAATFVGIFKTAVVNSSLKNYSASFNCEEDDCEALFTRFSSFIGTNQTSHTTVEDNDVGCTSLSQSSGQVQKPSMDTLAEQEFQMIMTELTNNYVAGFILRRIKKTCTSCPHCKSALFSNLRASADDRNSLILAREYGGGWATRLCYPTEAFAKCFYLIHKVIIAHLHSQPHSIRLYHNLRDKLREQVDFAFLECNEHKGKVITDVLKISMRTCIHAWCNDINRILCGKDSRKYTGPDTIKLRAHDMYNKRKHRLDRGIKIL